MKKKTIFPVLFLSLIALAFIICSCNKEPEIKIETVTVTDTITVTETIILIDTVTVLDTIIETLPDTATTFILVRHAETTGIGSNPNLSTEGETRAIELARILDNVPLEAVFSTNFNRTMQTAEPTATDKSLIVENYDPFDLDPFIDAILVNHKEGVVLVVGHSNTTPSLLNILVGANIYSDLPESEYDNLFVVTVFEKGRANVIHMKYGE